MRAGYLLGVLALGVLAAGARAEPYPADSGIINVRAYGAKGNGRTDDTAAILRALAASGEDTGRSFWHDRIVYFPHGTYLVSAPLLKRYADGRFASGAQLVGEAQSNTIIRLADHAPGFDDPKHPRAVIFTASKLLDGGPTGGGKDYVGAGEGNDAYMNFVEDLTIDVGHGNLGAAGIDFLGNNLDAIRNVTLRASADSGAVGLSMTRKWPGPTLVQNLTILGFDKGIVVANTEYGVTFDGIHMSGQRDIALHNNGNALAIRNIDIAGRAPLIRNDGDTGFIAIDSALLTAEMSAPDLSSAIDNTGYIRTRAVKVEARNWDWRQVAGPLNGVLHGQDKWQAIEPSPWLPTPASSPRAARPPLKTWANITRYGAVPDPHADAGPALRAAFASGAAVVYLPTGSYAVGDTIEIPATVQRIVGMNSTIQVLAGRPPLPVERPIFRVATGGAPLTIERLHFDNTDQPTRIAVEAAGARDVTIRDSIGAGVILLNRTAQGGRAFLENVCCGRFQFAGAAPVFARQLNTEGNNVRITNIGSPLWILGLKTEGVATIVDNSQGARTDIFGGLIYMVRDGAGDDVPAFRNANSWLTGSFVEESLRPESRYSAYVTQQSVAGEQITHSDAFPTRGYGRFVPRLVSGPGPEPPPPQ
jgi:hypothetical protein